MLICQFLAPAQVDVEGLWVQSAINWLNTQKLGQDSAYFWSNLHDKFVCLGEKNALTQEWPVAYELNSAVVSCDKFTFHSINAVNNWFFHNVTSPYFSQAFLKWSKVRGLKFNEGPTRLNVKSAPALCLHGHSELDPGRDVSTEDANMFVDDQESDRKTMFLNCEWSRFSLFWFTRLLSIKWWRCNLILGCHWCRNAVGFSVNPLPGKTRTSVKYQSVSNWKLMFSNHYYSWPHCVIPYSGCL